MTPDPDLLEAGPDRPRRRWPVVLVVAAVVAVAAVVQVPRELERRDERADRARVDALVRLSGGDAEGGGQELDGSVALSYRLTNEGPRPLRLVLLRLRGGGIVGERRLSETTDPLLPGTSRSFTLPLVSADCPGAVTSAAETSLEVVVETADGRQRTVVVPREWPAPFSGEAMVRAAREACDRPTPVFAANASFRQVRVRDATATGVLVVAPVDRTVVLLRLLPVDGLAWSTTTTLPLRVRPGTKVRVPVRATKGDCSGVADVGEQGSIGYEVAIESAPGDSYVEPPQPSFTSGETDGEALGDLRDRLCGVTRATTS